MMEKNINPHRHVITSEFRSRLNGHMPALLWFTGLSGSGKSTIADYTEQILFARGTHTYLLDGDNVRTGLNVGLGFSEEGRYENLRRIAEVAKLFVDAGIIILCAFVSPLKKDRDMVKQIVGCDNFIEIFINTSLEECERRDTKGLYKKARLGEIKDFTGISAPYEAPESPDIIISTDKTTIESATDIIIKYLENKNIFSYE